MSTQELADQELRERYARASQGIRERSTGGEDDFGAGETESRNGAVTQYRELRQEMARRGFLDDAEA